ncbi:MAG: transaldolase family protein [Planctomycetota bacterium]
MLARTVADLVQALAGDGPVAPPAGAAVAQHTGWQALRATGSELWVDAADFDGARAVWSEEFSGMTTNNALLQADVADGRHDELIVRAGEQLRRAPASHGLAPDALVTEVAFVLNAVHGLRLARAFDATVCVELHTDLAGDADGSVEYGRRLHAIAPDRFVVKVPLTPAGLLAVRRLEAAGVPVNCTLGFSPRQNRLAAEYARPHFVNAFLGRVDGLLDRGRVAAGDAGIAAARSSQRVLPAPAPGGAAHEVRQIAASLRSAEQLPALAGVDVLTMPPDVARDFVAGGEAMTAGLRDRTGDALSGDARDALTAADAGVFCDDGELAAVVAHQLALRDDDGMDEPRLRAVLRDHGLGDLFPELTAADRVRLADDGKLPDWDHWRGRVADRSVSWDGLLNAAGLGAFSAAQRDLDGRIRRLLS